VFTMAWTASALNFEPPPPIVVVVVAVVVGSCLCCCLLCSALLLSVDSQILADEMQQAMQALHVALGTAVFSKQQRARNVLTNPRSKRTIVASSTAQEQNAQSTSTSRMPTRREALSVSTASLLAAVVAPALIHVPAAAAAGGGSVSTVRSFPLLQVGEDTSDPEALRALVLNLR